jgi:hypothetical protein
MRIKFFTLFHSFNGKRRIYHEQIEQKTDQLEILFIQISFNEMKHMF